MSIRCVPRKTNGIWGGKYRETQMKKHFQFKTNFMPIKFLLNEVLSALFSEKEIVTCDGLFYIQSAAPIRILLLYTHTHTQRSVDFIAAHVNSHCIGKLATV